MKVSIINKRRRQTGKIELLLKYYEKGISKYKSTGLILFDQDFKKLSNEEKRHNREALKEAEIICNAENEKYRLGKFGIDVIQKQRSSFIKFVERVAKERSTSDGNIGNWNSMIKHLKEFAKFDITFEQVDHKFLNDFKTHLDKKLQKTGKPLSTNSKLAYYNKLRAALKQAVKEDIITKNPALGTTGFKSEDVQREFLTLEELKLAVKTECEMPILKRAFLFSCLTGLRWSDCIKLKWSDIQDDKQHGKFIRFKQKKTKGAETLFLPEDAVKIIGEHKHSEELVFKGLKYSAWNNLKLKQWMMKAGIPRDITFHSARHTYAVLQLDNGTDIFTLSKLLGHKDLKTTLIYSKILDKNKKVASTKIKLDIND